MVKRREFLAKTAAVTGSAIFLPAMVGESFAKITARDTSSDGFVARRIKLEKGQSVFFVNPRTAAREQLSAVVATLEVDVPASNMKTMPAQTSTRRLPVMKMT